MKNFLVQLASLVFAQCFVSYVLGYISFKFDLYIVSSLSLSFILGFMYRRFHNHLFSNNAKH